VAEDINPVVNDMFRSQERIVPFVGDVATESAAQDAVALAVERFGRLDILVNNAASIVYKNAVDMTLDEWNSILGISSTGVFLHSREALKVMIPNQTGAIVNIGSYACYQTFPGISAYAAAKGALAQITRTLALEAVGHGIRGSRGWRCGHQPPQFVSRRRSGVSSRTRKTCTHQTSRAARGNCRGRRLPRVGKIQLHRRRHRHGRWRYERHHSVSSPPEYGFGDGNCGWQRQQQMNVVCNPRRCIWA
jgi:NADP-dependent 3-hydroxy acid dehydrogenase YdfG